MLDNIRQLFDLSERVALCTGGSSGIGRRMALTLSQAGADVVLVGRNEASLAEAMEQIKTEGGCG
jgi:gluconate 5-dehydrogenase